ncbi:MAG: acyl--CoA ligase [Myxococcota bacterium]|jgi:fatty-acyl-CoA synthase|nr:acyl--CoA ligase [Myxococcota bacterium]
MHDFLRRWASIAPDRIAIEEVASATRGARAWTYGSLDDRAARIAAGLAATLPTGARIALVSEGRAEVFELLFACARAKLTLVPLNTRQPLTKLRAIVASAEPAAVVYDDTFVELAHELLAHASITEPSAWETNGTTRVTPRGIALGDRRARGEDVAYESLLGAARYGDVALEDVPLVLYTSGTTAAPKGVCITWRQVVFNAVSTALAAGLTEHDRALACLPLFHTGGLHCLATPLLHRGGSIVLTPGFDAEREVALLHRGDVTTTIAVPTMYESLLAAGLHAQPHLRALLCGGAPLSRALHERFHDAGLPMRQGYGLTEVGPNCFTLSPLDGPHRFGTVGVPTFHLEARLVRDGSFESTGSAADGSECDANEPGELWLRGPAVTTGYFRAPELTAQVLDADGYFHTGDVLVRDEDGFFAVVDRKKDMFVSGGENVYPAAVAAALAMHPAFAEVAVVPVPDARWGEVGLACFVLREDVARPSDEALRAWSRAHLAGYEIPRHWRALDALPRTATGKTDRAALRTIVEEGNHERT